MLKATWSLVLVIGLLAVAALIHTRTLRAQEAQPSAGPQPGATCKVYFRGDASGMAIHDRVLDLDNLIIRKGAYAGSDGAWLTLKTGDGEPWIPRSSIMAIEVTK